MNSILKIIAVVVQFLYDLMQDDKMHSQPIRHRFENMLATAEVQLTT